MNNPCHSIGKCIICGDRLHTVVDGVEYIINLREFSEELANCPVEVKKKYEISPSGYGIRWVDIDEDLSFDYLIGAKPLEADWHLHEVERRR